MGLVKHNRPAVKKEVAPVKQVPKKLVQVKKGEDE